MQTKNKTHTNDTQTKPWDKTCKKTKHTNRTPQKMHPENRTTPQRHPLPLTLSPLLTIHNSHAFKQRANCSQTGHRHTQTHTNEPIKFKIWLSPPGYKQGFETSDWLIKSLVFKFAIRHSGKI